MGCHTILGEGAYYAPELTKVYERRGPIFIAAMLRDPEAMYPGQRKMQNYDFTEAEIQQLVDFLEWIGNIDLNGFPPKPDLMQVAVNDPGTPVPDQSNRPKVFNQLCVACHRLNNQGGIVGPALDGIGSRLERAFIVDWLKDPQKIKPGTAMPKLDLTEEQIVELAAFLSQQKQAAAPEKKETK